MNEAGCVQEGTTGERKREPLEYIRRAGGKNSNGRTEYREPMKAAEKYFFIRELRSNEKVYIYIHTCIYWPLCVA